MPRVSGRSGLMLHCERISALLALCCVSWQARIIRSANKPERGGQTGGEEGRDSGAAVRRCQAGEGL